MSNYSIIVRVEHGTPSIQATNGTVPDGVYTVSGNQDEQGRSFGATHSTLDLKHSVSVQGGEQGS